MQSKYEAWIPTLGREVDATKPAWKFDRFLMRSKYEAWIPILDFVEVHATKPAWRSTGNQVILQIQMRSENSQMHENHKLQNSRLSVECKPEMIQSRIPQIYKRKGSPHI